MSKANEMFKKLGYIYYDDDGIDTYEKKVEKDHVVYKKFLDCKEISFDRLSEEMYSYEYYKDITDKKLLDMPYSMHLISFSREELNAITEKLKELRWQD